ncbi:MAG: PAS domain S-box protein [Actinobacteria bacterium]|nr:PAS domain S-box protein [Actinomycetota bacterium]
MLTRDTDARDRPSGLVLLLTAALVTVGFLVLPPHGRPRVILAETLVGTACAVSAWVIWVARRQQRAWAGTGHFAALLMGMAIVDVGFMTLGVATGSAQRASAWDVGFLVFAVPLLLAVRQEFHAHLRPELRREIWVDVTLVTVSLSVIAYVLMRPDDAAAGVSLSTAAFAFVAAVPFASFGGLAAWVPSRGHLAQFAILTGLGIATIQLGWQWVHGEFHGASIVADVAFSAGAIALATFVGWAPPTWLRGRDSRISRWGRPVLTSAAVAAALAALGFVATGRESGGISPGQARWLVAALGAAAILRLVTSQVRSTHASEHVSAALEQKEVALREADTALDRVRETNETLRESEEHLRLVFEAASDGIVELNGEDVVVRVNDAFCQMVGLSRELIEGQAWTALAAAVRGADPSLASLPETGQAEIKREGQPLYLESRTSDVPLEPPRKLLLVRDVTAGRVADRTIRSLLQFLQDRDEDRTRIMRRTNVAIESERNRIARDLHDGPVQGVSAASLSLEAALLMIKAGDVERGLEVLGRIREQLSHEADALRLLMSGLRPPLLEERGLIPALRETVARFGAGNGVDTSFTAGPTTDVPDDLETLAYRVVQEALSNVAKHAKASRVSVHVGTDPSQLRVEIVDDGIGFDAAQAREFLRMGRVGLASMRERVELASGTFLVHSTPGKGTTILAALPLDVIAIRDLTPTEA